MPRRRADAGGRSLGRVPSAALVTGELALFERDHTLAHLVDHLAVVRDHQDRRAGAVDPVEELHDPDRRVGVEIARRLVADEERRGGGGRAPQPDALAARRRAHGGGGGPPLAPAPPSCYPRPPATRPP